MEAFIYRCSPLLSLVVVVELYAVLFTTNVQGNTVLRHNSPPLFYVWLYTSQSRRSLARYQIVHWETHESTSKYFARHKVIAKDKPVSLHIC